ncbi:MAG TPA: PfkB family carbohydrate kinase [Fimbriimonas sp.]|nr:PfkB family carbohydrate kinase [Fimbriimonas sp.]
MEKEEALVVGHICLDIIPELRDTVVFEPGHLVEAGPATLSTGGAVSNTGVSLSRLGVKTRLLGKIGPGIFGRAIFELLEGSAPDALHSMTIEESENTSYTVVISLTGKDRMFLHSPGANRSFGSADVTDEMLEKARLMHLGYPPLLERMFADDGRELVELFRRAKEAGVTTSLDMSLPDSEAPSGKANWELILSQVLPYVDFFLPSVEELLYMLERRIFENLKGAVYGQLPEKIVEKVAKRTLDMGARNFGVKVGTRGFYLHVGDCDPSAGRGRPAWEKYRGLEVWHPCFKVKVEGTTGAGDATIAGFLKGMLQGFDPAGACQAAVAAGAFCCERPDAVSGVKPWPQIKARIDAGWATLPLELDEPWEKRGLAYFRQT